MFNSEQRVFKSGGLGDFGGDVEQATTSGPVENSFSRLYRAQIPFKQILPLEKRSGDTKDTECKEEPCIVSNVNSFPKMMETKCITSPVSRDLMKLREPSDADSQTLQKHVSSAEPASACTDKTIHRRFKQQWGKNASMRKSEHWLVTSTVTGPWSQSPVTERETTYPESLEALYDRALEYRVKWARPYFKPEPACTQLRREAHSKDTRRKLRLELETQMDCDPIRRVGRTRRLYQLPAMPKCSSIASRLRLLAMPLSMPTMLRLGVMRSRVTSSLGHGDQYPMTQVKRRLKKRGYRGGRLYSGCRTREVHEVLHNEQQINANQVIGLYKFTAELMYSYPGDSRDKISTQRWVWQGGDCSSEVDETPQYMDPCRGLLVRHQKSVGRGYSRIRRQFSSVTERGDVSSFGGIEEALIKVALESRDWRESLLTQGLTIDHEVGSPEEHFLRQLIALQRLRLLTQLEESENIMHSDGVIQPVHEHTVNPKCANSLSEWCRKSDESRLMTLYLPQLKGPSDATKMPSRTPSNSAVKAFIPQKRKLPSLLCKSHALPITESRYISSLQSTPCAKNNKSIGRAVNKITPKHHCSLSASPSSMRTTVASGRSRADNLLTFPDISPVHQAHERWKSHTGSKRVNCGNNEGELNHHPMWNAARLRNIDKIARGYTGRKTVYPRSGSSAI